MEGRKRIATISFDLVVDEQIDLLKNLINMGINPKIGKLDIWNWSILNGHTEIVKMLIEAGVKF